MKANIGLIGVGVMGENLVMNIESRGYTVACYDLLLDKTKAFVEEGIAAIDGLCLLRKIIDNSKILVLSLFAHSRHPQTVVWLYYKFSLYY